jgi:hypothetical protein
MLQIWIIVVTRTLCESWNVWCSVRTVLVRDRNNYAIERIAVTRDMGMDAEGDHSSPRYAFVLYDVGGPILLYCDLNVWENSY